MTRRIFKDYGKEVVVPTRAQREALLAVYRRTPLEVTFLQFRRSAEMSMVTGTFMVPWQGMVLGIELDGYTHS